MSIRLLLFINVFQVTSLIANRVMLALFALALGADPLTVGILAAMFSLFPATLAVAVGKLVDRFGGRWLMIGGSVCAAMGMLLAHFAPSLSLLLVAGALVGQSLVFYNVTTQNLTGLLSTPQNRARNFSNYSLCNSTGQLLGPLAAGFAIDHFGHAESCLYFGLFTLVPAVMLLLRRGPLEPSVAREAGSSAKAEVAPPTGGLRVILGDPSVRRTLITGSMLSSGSNLYTAYLPVYAHSVGLSASVIGVILAMNSAAAFVIRAVLPHMIARLKEEKALAISFFTGAASLMLVPLFNAAAMLGLLSFIFGLGMGAGQPIVTMLMFANSPAGRSGESIGIKVTTNHVTNMVSPVVFGAVATAMGLFPMFWLNALMLGTAGWLSLPKKRG